MLAGARAADDLLAATFRGAPSAAGHDELVLRMVRTFVRSAPARRREDPTGPLVVLDDPGDVLTNLRPRERAATVLRRVERWSATRVAEAIGVPRTSVARLVPPGDGLEQALRALADQHTRPAADTVRAVLDRLPDPGRQHHDEDRLRRRAAALADRPWTWRILAAAVVLGLLVWARAAGEAPPPAATEDPAETVPVVHLVDGAVLPALETDLTWRGWRLGPDGEVPDDLEGLRLVETVDIDLARADDILLLDTRPRAGAAVFAALWCELPALDAQLVAPTAHLVVRGRTVDLPCAGTSGEPPVSRLVPLPPAADRERTAATVTWSGDVPRKGRALLATWTEVGGDPRRAPATGLGEPVVPATAAVVDGDSPAYTVGDRTVHHQRVRIGDGSTVTVWAGAPGEVSVQVDDTLLTDDGEPPTAAAAPGAGDWRTADPELRGGRWLVYAPGRARVFDLPAGAVPGPGGRREVTVSVSTTLDPGQWQVQVGDARVVPVDEAPLPLEALGDVDAPEWIGGFRLVAAWRVPNDGIPHPLVDPDLPPGRRFFLVGTPPGTGRDDRGVVRPHVATTRGPAPVTVVPDVADAFDERVWRAGDQLVQAGASIGDLRTGKGTGVVAVTAPAVPGPTAGATLLAYVPVDHEDFDFAAAPPMAVSTPVGVVRADPLAGSTVSVARYGRDDLDADGRLRVDAGTGDRVWLRLTTEGAGRVRVLESGRPAVWLPDGWWTSWTARRVVTDLPLQGTGFSRSSGRPLELVVEGYEEHFTVEVLVRGDGAPGST